MEFNHLVIAATMNHAELDGWIPDGEGQLPLPLHFLPNGAGWGNGLNIRLYGPSRRIKSSATVGS